MSRMSVAQFLEACNFEKAQDGDEYYKIQEVIEDTFYDWFCETEELFDRGERMVEWVKMAAESGKFDPDKTYVFFKNNAPLRGDLYDSFSICDLETGDVIYWVGMEAHGREMEVCSPENDFREPIVEGSWEIRKFFKKAA